MNHTLVIMAAGLGSRFGAGAGQKPGIREADRRKGLRRRL